MGEIDLNRDLVCVLFPGIVNNDEKALQCLGGIKNISQVGIMFVLFKYSACPTVYGFML